MPSIKNPQKNYFTRAGFTLVELLLSLAVLGIVATISIPVYQSFQTKNDLDLAANTVVQSLRRAQILSQSGESASGWGVFIQPGSLVVFQGSSYSTRNSIFDETTNIPSNIVPSGLIEIVFSPLWGEVATVGSTTLASPGNSSKTISVNSQGVINY